MTAEIESQTDSQFQPLLSEAARELETKFHASHVRIWRYVDSQMVLFGCPTDDGASRGEPPAFGERVAFLREDSGLAAYSAQLVACLSDTPVPPEEDSEEKFRHKLWYVPNYESLHKDHRLNYAEAILVRENGQGASLKNLVGVVCIDAPYKEYEDLVKQGEGNAIKELLESIRDMLINYSNALFRSGFDRAEKYLRTATRVFVEEKAIDIKACLGGLSEALDPPREAEVALYLRSVNGGSDEVPLSEGIGEYYQQMKRVEAYHRKHTPQEFFEQLFSSRAKRELAVPPKAARDDDTSLDGSDQKFSVDAILFPGSRGDVETYRRYRRWFVESRTSMTHIPEQDKGDTELCAAADWVTGYAEQIETTGSFGVFPIRCMAENTLKGQLVGLLCVAVNNKQNFFTWNRRLVIERLCELLARLHDTRIAPVLHRVRFDTHKDLIASGPTLYKLLGHLGPLDTHDIEDDNRSCKAFVLSVDIRKSTDLMLKVLPGHAQDYAKVLTRITEAMREAVKDEYGIFDKFTGDGVLAFFPHFFSGATHIDGGYRALAAAERCHKIFAAEYEHLWKHLIAVPAPGSTEYEIPGAIGLGIGIDYGIVHLVNVGEELTIVGAPAVFACRLSSTARACTTLLNQRGFDALNGAPYLAWQRENARLKHEDAPTVAYRVRLSNEPHRLPNWSLGNNAERWRAWLEP